jgi:8-oxo-dGTP diphosphatase
MQNYRRTVDHIDRLSKERMRSEVPPEKRRPSIASDAVVVRESKGRKQVLLIMRANEPYKGMWALPGGFVEYGESGEEAVLRELEEETGLKGSRPSLRTVRSQPGRDPRGHVVSLVYTMTIKGETDPRSGDDASKAKWFEMASLPDLAFDHREIIDEVLG